MRYVILIAVLLSFTVPAKAEGVWVQGNYNCGLWLVRQEAGITAKVVEAWLVGLLSGVALYSNKDFWAIGNSTTPDQVYNWMDDFCRDNPLRDVFKGANVLFVDKVTYDDAHQ